VSRAARRPRPRPPPPRPRTAEIQRELALLEKERETLLVRAPKSGRVVALEAFEGDRLAAGRRMLRLAPAAQEMHIDAWIPERHQAYAEPGQRATVTFADGVERAARVVAVPEAAHPLPAVLAGSYGTREPGLLVRMDFIDDGGPVRRPVVDGARVRIRFAEPQQVGLIARVQQWWSGPAHDVKLEGSS
jgi:multidrug efflux pump subunit AcrA (membrane-fusion protein)